MQCVGSMALVVPLVASACFSPNSAGSVDTGDSTSSGTTTLGSPTSDTTPDPATTVVDTTTDSSMTGDSSTTTDASSTAVDTESGPVCGDGEIGDGEVCDDGVNDGAYGGCEPGCSQRAPHCGDEIVHQGEVCDDGNSANGDGCNVDCVESGSILWTRTFGSSNAESVAVAADDGVALIETGAVLRRYDAAGTPIWDTEYDAPAATSTSGAVVAYHEEAGWLFAGQANYTAQGFDVWWRVLDDDAGGLASGSYNNSNDTSDLIGGAAFDGAANFAISWRSDNGDDDHYLRLYNAAADPLWTQMYDGGDDDAAAAVTIDGAGNLIVGGWTNVDDQGSNGWLRKYDPQGATLWTRTVVSGEEPSSDQITSVAVGPRGEIAVAGHISDDIFVRYYDDGGAEQWTALHDGPAEGMYDLACSLCLAYDVGRGVAVDSAGAVVVVGAQVVDSDDGTYETWVRKYDADGDELWTWNDGPDLASHFGASGVAVDSEDRVVVVGDWGAQGWMQKFAP